jgi:hypothetical protein
MKTSLSHGNMPKAKPGDFERALQLAATFGSKEDVMAGLQQLRDAKAAADEANSTAQATMAAATKRDTLAREAEAAATRARQALADETKAAHASLAQREGAVADRENLAAEAEKSQGLRDQELIRREDHLRKAGVAGF